MGDFFWVDGRFGWGFFALVIFTAFWWIAFDVVWRLKQAVVVKLLTKMSIGWIVGAGIIVLIFYEWR